MITPQLALHKAVDDVELAALEAQWGPQTHHTVRLEVSDPFLTGEHQMLVKDGRRAEICYIMHRGRPADGLLLHIKTVYPQGAYRLPTGGIHQGERVMETLAREIAEETGLQVGAGPDHVQVQRMLGVVSYELARRQLGRSFPFATYHFLVQMPPDATLNPLDPAEMIGGWRWCPPHELPAVAEYLAQVGAWSPQWADWGRYRTISHRFVADVLGA
jgi:8-oxo-dGTP pyrophosphatase MutT (NUDIX family)